MQIRSILRRASIHDKTKSTFAYLRQSYQVVCWYFITMSPGERHLLNSNPDVEYLFDILYHDDFLMTSQWFSTLPWFLGAFIAYHWPCSTSCTLTKLLVALKRIIILCVMILIIDQFYVASFLFLFLFSFLILAFFLFIPYFNSLFRILFLFSIQVIVHSRYCSSTLLFFIRRQLVQIAIRSQYTAKRLRI